MTNNWKELYENEVKLHYGTWENYFAQKFKLKKPLIDLLLKNAGLSPDKPTIECGVGTGKLASLIASKGFTSYGLDVDGEMLKHARAFSNSVTPDNPVKLINADIRKLNFADKYFSLAHSGGVLEHFPDDVIVQVLGEQIRVADNVVFAVPSTYFLDDEKMNNERRIHKNDWRKLIHESGGEIFSETGYHYRPFKSRMVEQIKRPQKIFLPKANFVFEITGRS